MLGFPPPSSLQASRTTWRCGYPWDGSCLLGQPARQRLGPVPAVAGRGQHCTATAPGRRGRSGLGTAPRVGPCPRCVPRAVTCGIGGVACVALCPVGLVWGPETAVSVQPGVSWGRAPHRLFHEAPQPSSPRRVWLFLGLSWGLDALDRLCSVQNPPICEMWAIARWLRARPRPGTECEGREMFGQPPPWPSLSRGQAGPERYCRRAWPLGKECGGEDVRAVWS